MAETADIAANLTRVRERIRRACEASGRDPESVQLLPVSKRQATSKIQAIYDLGVASLAENRVQELAEKAEELSALELSWQMVGSLQTNKVRQLLRVPNLSLLQTVDRPSLVQALQRELAAGEYRLPVLLQINATGEERKHGVVPSQAAELLRLAQQTERLQIEGLMAMGPLAGDPAPVFARVAELANELRQHSSLPLPVLSLGMTGDLEAAVAAGSTMVRVGTGIFGRRPASE